MLVRPGDTRWRATSTNGRENEPVNCTSLMTGLSGSVFHFSEEKKYIWRFRITKKMTDFLFASVLTLFICFLLGVLRKLTQINFNWTYPRSVADADIREESAAL